MNWQNWKKFCHWALFLLWLFIGFRSLTSGQDTMSYYENYVSGQFGWYDEERAYTIYTQILHSIFGNSAILFLLFTSAPYILALDMFLTSECKNESEVLIGIHMIFLLSIFGFIIAGIRQALAMAFVLMSYKYLFKKKKGLLWFAVFLLLAISFHNSAIVAVLLLPLRYLKRFGYLQLLIPLAAVIVSLFYTSAFFTFTEMAMGESERFAAYTNIDMVHKQSYSLFGIQMILILFCLLNKQTRQWIKVSDEAIFFLNCSIMGTACHALATNLAEMFRISYYFSIFLIPLFATTVSNLKQKGIFTAGFVVFVIIYIFLLSSSGLTNYSLIFF